MTSGTLTSKETLNLEAINRVDELIRQNNLQFVDIKFNDLPGLWQHFSIPVSELAEIDDPLESIWQEGIGFDGSSIRGFQKIQESDMILLLDPESAVIDPVCKIPTLSIICDIYDPLSRTAYTRDPRNIAKKAEAFLIESGIATKSYWGPELEFFLFNDVRFEQTENQGFYYVDSIEGEWNSGRIENPNLGYKPRYKEGYFPVPPHDSLQDIRSEMVLALVEAGVPIEVHHHEVATGGQCEIDIKYDTLVLTADRCMMYKYIIKNIARKYNMIATFMPKPLFGDNGSGMHCHQSLWQHEENIFFDPTGYGLISETAKYYIGGLLKHAGAILAFCAPTTNSYKRLVPGYEAPVNLAYSARNRSAAVRIPVYTDNPKSKRIEFRPPDCSANPYLAFAAMQMAGLDGIINKIDPGAPIDSNIYEMTKNGLPKVPSSLEEAINALERDNEFLTRGNVFTEDVIQVWIEYKRSREIDALRLRPHPYEFHLYFDI